MIRIDRELFRLACAANEGPEIIDVPLMEKGFVERTEPTHPQSPQQKCRLA